MSFTVPELAKRFKVSLPTARSWIESGDLEAIDVSPARSKRKMYRVEESAVTRFEQSRKVHKPVRMQVPPEKTRRFV